MKKRFSRGNNRSWRFHFTVFLLLLLLLQGKCFSSSKIERKILIRILFTFLSFRLQFPSNKRFRQRSIWFVPILRNHVMPREAKIFKRKLIDSFRWFSAVENNNIRNNNPVSLNIDEPIVSIKPAPLSSVESLLHGQSEIDDRFSEIPIESPITQVRSSVEKQMNQLQQELLLGFPNSSNERKQVDKRKNLFSIWTENDLRIRTRNSLIDDFSFSRSSW